MGKLTKTRPPKELQNPGVVHNIVKGLFPVHPLRNPRPWQREDPPKISKEELARAAYSLRTKIAPGMDGINNEALKIIAKRQPEMLLEIYNKCLEERRFPTVWKRARLVLIKKGDKPLLEPASYRPLCLIDCTGKLFEKIIDNRVRDFLESDTQSGLQRTSSASAASVALLTL